VTSQEKVRQLFGHMQEWAAANIPLLGAFLAGMSEEFEQVLPENPALLDQHLLEIGCLLITGRSDGAPAIGIYELHPALEEDEEDVWHPVHFTS
jgi:hypothetical protein